MEEITKEYSIRLANPNDGENISNLLNHVFQPWPRFDIGCSLADHWRWKFIDNPANVHAQASDRLPHVVAVDKNGIIGVTHGMLYYNKIGESTCLCHKGVDVAVDDSYRGQRVYTKLTKRKHEVNKELKEGFTYSLTANPILINRKRDEENFLFPYGIKYLVKVNDVKKHFMSDRNSKKGIKLKVGLHGAKILNKITNLNPQPPSTNIEIKEVEKFDDRVNTFYNKVKTNYAFIVEKNAEYLNWRYCDKRGGDFKSWIAEENGEISGFIVLRVNRIDPAYPKGFVMDLLVLDGRLDLVENLVSFASIWFDNSEVNMVHAQLVAGHAYEAVFDKYGFLDSRIKPHLTYRPMNISAKDLEIFRNAPPSALHYPYGEGDAI
jgi:hypothetical protein